MDLSEHDTSRTSLKSLGVFVTHSSLLIFHDLAVCVCERDACHFN